MRLSCRRMTSVEASEKTGAIGSSPSPKTISPTKASGSSGR